MKVQIERDRFGRFVSANIQISDVRELSNICLSLMESINDYYSQYRECLENGWDVEGWKQRFVDAVSIFVQLRGEEGVKAHPDIFALARNLGVL